jgi:hypothetical protein
MYWKDEAHTKLAEIRDVTVSNPMLEVADNAKCDACGPSYQLEIRQKFISLEVSDSSLDATLLNISDYVTLCSTTFRD